MKTNHVARTALALGLSASVAVAQGTACATVLVPTYSPPSVAAGWQAQLVAGGLTKPRSIEFDSTGALLVVESGKGVTRQTFTDNKGTCLIASQSTLLINDTTLNHGLALSVDGKTLYASSVKSVFAWDYDAKAGTVGAKPRTIVDNMSNTDLVTRTLLISKLKANTLIVSRGSADANEVKAETLSNGLSQIRAFDLSKLNATSDPFNYNTDGAVLGWGLRNSVGVGEHPITGGIYAVENSIDGVTRNGKDIHENNPGEELNFFGNLSVVNKDPPNYGYPKCFAVWNVTEIPQNDGLHIGSQFAVDEENLTDEKCNDKYVEPRLTLPAHYAPLDIKFDKEGSTAYVTFHGSFDKTNPVGYRVSSIAFDAKTGDPVAKANSTDFLTDILSNDAKSVCPGACFRPAGLAFDAAGRLWMTADSTGEIYVLEKLDGTPTATASGTIVTATGTAKNAAPAVRVGGWGLAGLVAVVGLALM
ncbi:soluble quino protein glucose/sorbosone dehydrogenase [Podospora appendiculata]|uniref:Soluble quino protein glucose/sorbosone dehydrogenase n=1 Tax=Podospora appendiculata TaxID=314037 RepID=A0AAE1CGC3_9PEZI|nr:soluble quino protein glucose/sorbosone dehydrogenase [Podospora appendiculata]